MPNRVFLFNLGIGAGGEGRVLQRRGEERKTGKVKANQSQSEFQRCRNHFDELRPTTDFSPFLVSDRLHHFALLSPVFASSVVWKRRWDCVVLRWDWMIDAESESVSVVDEDGADAVGLIGW
ncbi:hypothetical protein V6N13_071507 [Hibiscus sabdariffa]